MANQSIYNAFERMWQHVVSILNNKSDSNHTHDDIYYTEAEVDSRLDEKSPVGHNHIYYGVCSTAADTVAKTVTVDNFTLTTGAMVIVKFTNDNSVASPTLNVNETGAKPIYRYGTTTANTGTTTTGWRAGAVQIFVYDGTGWIRDFWENTTYSNVALGQGYATCTTAAATVAKVGTLASYTLATGGIVSVKFSYDVPASATLNINSKGAKSIYFRGSAITAGIIKAGDIATFIYSGQYHLISIDRWQNDITTKYDELSAAIDGKAALSHGTHVTYATTEPKMDGTASAGSATTVARTDHVHPVDTSRASQADLDTLESAVAYINATEEDTGEVPSTIIEYVDFTSDQTAYGVKSFPDGIKIGNAHLFYDAVEDAVVISFE